MNSSNLINSLSILYIGDNSEDIAILKATLEERVKSLSCCANIDFGIKRLEEGGIDVLIIGIENPAKISKSMLDTIGSIEVSLQIIYIANVNNINILIKETKPNVYYIKRPIEEIILINTLIFIAINLFYKKQLDTKEIIHSILDLNRSFIIMLDQKLTIKYINKPFLQFLDCSSLDEFEAKKISLLNYITSIDQKKLTSSMLRGNILDRVWIEGILSSDTNTTISLQDPKLLTESFFIISHTYLDSLKYHILSLTEITSIVKERDKLINQLEVDYITGLYNRQKFEIIFNDAIQQKIDNEKHLPLSLIFCDIDHFKKVNDTYGHTIGDEVLKELGSLILSSIRGEDIATRWGGEEFIILVWRDKYRSKIQANRLRKRIEKHNFNSMVSITCSFGIAEFQEGDDATALLQRSDEAMYKAKENGRNQVQLFSY